jgi:hypothetical protein
VEIVLKTVQLEGQSAGICQCMKWADWSRPPYPTDGLVRGEMCDCEVSDRSLTLRVGRSEAGTEVPASTLEACATSTSRAV